MRNDWFDKTLEPLLPPCLFQNKLHFHYDALISVNCPHVIEWLLWPILFAEFPISAVLTSLAKGCTSSSEDHQIRHFVSGFMYEFLRQWKASENSGEFCKVPIILRNKQTKVTISIWYACPYHVGALQNFFM